MLFVVLAVGMLYSQSEIADVVPIVAIELLPMLAFNLSVSCLEPGVVGSFRMQPQVKDHLLYRLAFRTARFLATTCVEPTQILPGAPALTCGRPNL